MRKLPPILLFFFFVLASFPISALDREGNGPFFVIQSRTTKTARAFLVGPNEPGITPLPSVNLGIYNRQIMVAGLEDRAILYCLDRTHFQSAYLFDTRTHRFVRKLDLGEMPAQMIDKGCYWVNRKEGLTFFGNMGVSREGTMTFYDFAGDSVRMRSIGANMLDVCTDGRGNIHITAADGTVRQYDPSGSRLLSSIQAGRTLQGIIRLGAEMAFLDTARVETTYESRETHFRVTRYEGTMYAGDPIDLGEIHKYQWRPEVGVLLALGRSEMSILGREGRLIKVPSSMYTSARTDPSLTNLYVNGSRGITQIDLQNFVPITVKTGLCQNINAFEPVYGGGYGVLYKDDNVIAVDFRSNAFMKVNITLERTFAESFMSTSAAFGIYLPAPKRVVAYDPSTGRVQCFAFPGGEEAGQVQIGKAGKFLVPATDGRRIISIAPDRWVVLDAIDLTQRVLFEPEAGPRRLLDKAYIDYDSKTLRILRWDGVYLVDLPDAVTVTRIPCDWGGSEEFGRAGQLGLVPSSNASL